MEFDHKEYERLGLISNGANQIYKAKHKRNNKQLVLKFFENKIEQQKEWDMITEVVQMAQDSTNQAVLEKYLAGEDCGEIPKPFIVYTLCSKNLTEHLNEKLSEEIPGEMRNILAIHIFPALLFLHQNEIIHGDIKAENFMYSNRHWKLIDFGCSGHVGENAFGGTWLKSL
jgi:serine/threonine protein kinase